jgi:hypothetical protein
MISYLVRDVERPYDWSQMGHRGELNQEVRNLRCCI